MYIYSSKFKRYEKVFSKNSCLLLPFVTQFSTLKGKKHMFCFFPELLYLYKERFILKYDLLDYI